MLIDYRGIMVGNVAVLSPRPHASLVREDSPRQTGRGETEIQVMRLP
jgi:hypothetical protein